MDGYASLKAESLQIAMRSLSEIPSLFHSCSGHSYLEIHRDIKVSAFVGTSPADDRVSMECYSYEPFIRLQAVPEAGGETRNQFMAHNLCVRDIDAMFLDSILGPILAGICNGHQNFENVSLLGSIVRP